METEIEVLKGRLSILEMRLSIIDERLNSSPAHVVIEGPGKPIEVFVTDENLARLRRAVDRI